MRYVFFLLCSSFFSLVAEDRSSSSPYLTGDTFRFFCEFSFDEVDISMDPQQVKSGDLIYVHPDYLSEFVSRVHPRIVSHYCLITHNSDFLMPCFGRKACPLMKYLDDEKLIAWFGFNVDESKHPKLHTIPLGTANNYLGYGNKTVICKVQGLLPQLERNILLYSNFSKYTYPKERRVVSNFFKDKEYCTHSNLKDFEEYLRDLAQSKFVLSPRGYCEDCFRTWESILMGAIPIVKKSPLDSIFEGLPVLIIEDWNEISEEFLLEKYEEMKNTSYQMEKAYIFYWMDFIRSYSEPYRN